MTEERQWPHLRWYIIDGWPTLYRSDLRPRGTGFDTAAEACEHLGMDLENFIRNL